MHKLVKKVGAAVELRDIWRHCPSQCCCSSTVWDNGTETALLATVLLQPKEVKRVTMVAVDAARTEQGSRLLR